MANPVHIKKPVKRVMAVLEVYYTGNDFDSAIDAELKRLGLRHEDVRTIIAIPAEMATDDNRQMQLFQ
jgi:hypothetical protein